MKQEPIEIDPMTQEKEIRIEQILAKHSCPNCGCDYQEYPLNVMYNRLTTVAFGYANDKWIAIEEKVEKDELFSINCSKYDVGLISYFGEEFII